MLTHPSPQIKTPLTALLALVGLTLSACGAPPAPPKKSAPTTWAALINAPSEAPTGFKGEGRFELWLAEADEPSVEILEGRLSRSSVLASVNGSGLSYSVKMGEMVCEARWSEAPSAERADRAARCAPQLKADYSALISQAKGLISLRCAIQDIPSALDALKVSTSLSRDLEAVWVDPTQLACKLPERPKAYQVADFVRVKSTPVSEGGSLTLCTQGMATFGQAEVCLTPVIAEREEVAREALISIADSATRGAPVYEGAELTRGPASGKLAKTSALQAQLKLNAPKDSLVLVDPSAAAQDMEALKRLMMRFTLP